MSDELIKIPLTFVRHTEDAALFTLKEKGQKENFFWLAKSIIEVGGCFLY